MDVTNICYWGFRLLLLFTFDLLYYSICLLLTILSRRRKYFWKKKNWISITTFFGLYRKGVFLHMFMLRRIHCINSQSSWFTKSLKTSTCLNESWSSWKCEDLQVVSLGRLSPLSPVLAKTWAVYMVLGYRSKRRSSGHASRERVKTGWRAPQLSVGDDNMTT